MKRTIILTLTAAGLLVLSPHAMPGAQAQQQTIRVDLDQSLLDKSIIALPQIAKLGMSATVPQTEEELRKQLERICTDAGFDSYDQCAQVTGYVGMIISAWDQRALRFRDPIVLMRAQLSRLEADTSPPTPEREQTMVQMKEILGRFPGGVPRAHLDLATSNRDRIFEAIGRARG